MGLKNKLLYIFGPGYFPGITLGDWLRLLCKAKFKIPPSCWPRALMISLAAIPNSLLRGVEKLWYRSRLKNVEILNPIIILGHYRQGTTHLFNLLSIDHRYAFSNAYHACYPHTFLLTERFAVNKIGNMFLPKDRLIDKVQLHFEVPYEDEIAMTCAAANTPYLTLAFPKLAEHYDRYLTFRDTSEEEIAQWRDRLLLYLKKLTLKYQKPLILKSPPHTCRIKLLLEMFPNAKFIHIHRNPFEVYPSTINTMEVGFKLVKLQKTR